jgi:hypothetical protein
MWKGLGPDVFELYTAGPSHDVRKIDVTYPGLPHDVSVGATVLLDSGLIRMGVLDKDDTSVRCRVTTPARWSKRVSSTWGSRKARMPWRIPGSATGAKRGPGSS